MANWIYTLPLKDLWKRSETKGGDMSITELGKHVSERLSKLELPEEYDDIKDELVDEFQNVECVKDFDSILSDLYDLGDTPLPTPNGEMIRKLIWIETF